MRRMNKEIETEINTEIFQDGWDRIMHIELGKKIEEKLMWKIEKS